MPSLSRIRRHPKPSDCLHSCNVATGVTYTNLFLEHLTQTQQLCSPVTMFTRSLRFAKKSATVDNAPIPFTNSQLYAICAATTTFQPCRPAPEVCVPPTLVVNSQPSRRRNHFPAVSTRFLVHAFPGKHSPKTGYSARLAADSTPQQHNGDRKHTQAPYFREPSDRQIGPLATGHRRLTGGTSHQPNCPSNLKLSVTAPDCRTVTLLK